jgi:hypothetical protein
MLKFLLDMLAAISSQSVQSQPSGRFSCAVRRTAADGDDREDRRTRYIRTQAYQLAERFSKNGGVGIQLDEEEFNWLIIPRYPMPERWRQRWTQLMILFPAAYPDVPPTGFYLTIRGRLKSGAKDGHLYKGGGYYAEAPDLSEDGWHWYCVHAQVQVAGGWRPSADPAGPDNLFTFLNMAREALTTDE